MLRVYNIIDIMKLHSFFIIEAISFLIFYFYRVICNKKAAQRAT